MPKLVSIAISTCARCPHYGESFVPGPNSRGVYYECRNQPTIPKLIQPADEETQFPLWCPLPTTE